MGGLPPIKSHGPLNMWSQEVIRQILNIRSLLSQYMVTRFVRVLTYLEELPPKKWDEHLMTWSREVM